jgi:hypothetical protein
MSRIAFVLPFVLLGAAIPFAARAEGPEGTIVIPGALTYEVFETTVEHADLAECPAGFDGGKVFCRLTLASDGAHVFAFALDGDQPLVAVKSYEMDQALGF